MSKANYDEIQTTVGALWERQARNGQTYFTGVIEKTIIASRTAKVRIVVLGNGKQSGKSPNFYIKAFLDSDGEVIEPDADLEVLI